MNTNFDEKKWAHVSEVLHSELKTYLQKSGLKSVVLGESGGIDSALTSVIVSNVCRELGIAFIGRSIAIETNTTEEIERAVAVGKNFCTDFQHVDLTELYHQTVAAMEENPQPDTSKAYRLRMGNIKARLRMIYLYNLAQKHGGMVLSTDNRTEWLLGFWTLHGDVGDYDLLFGLWKTEVYQLANYLLGTLDSEQKRAALQACIRCVPTDGLGITSSDVEQFGAKTYDEVDAALQAYLASGENTINPLVVARHIGSQFKRENPFFVKRERYF